MINDMGSAALIPLEYYFSWIARIRIKKRWRRFLLTLDEMYSNQAVKRLIKAIE